VAAGEAVLIEAVESYLALRRSLGFVLHKAGCILRRFAKFSTDRGETHVVSATAITWAGMAGTPKERARRLSVVRNFALYARAEDDRHEVPPAGIFGRYRRQPLPYIYTPADIRRIVEAASHLGPTGSLRPDTYATLFGLLAATGLRICEALRLRVEDFTADGLIIRHSKFRKSRLVPLHETVVFELDRYLVRRQALLSTDPELFVSHLGSRLSYSRTSEVFRSLQRGLGLRDRPGRPNPRLHDLRHTFAVRALEACSGSRDHIDRHILALSTYMGHVSVESTYWYLQATPELMAGIKESWESFVKEAKS
jgi:integrase/recombinase XerD